MAEFRDQYKPDYFLALTKPLRRNLSAHWPIDDKQAARQASPGANGATGAREILDVYGNFIIVIHFWFCIMYVEQISSKPTKLRRVSRREMAENPPPTTTFAICIDNSPGISQLTRMSVFVPGHLFDYKGQSERWLTRERVSPCPRVREQRFRPICLMLPGDIDVMSPGHHTASPRC